MSYSRPLVCVRCGTPISHGFLCYTCETPALLEAELPQEQAAAPDLPQGHIPVGVVVPVAVIFVVLIASLGLSVPRDKSTSVLHSAAVQASVNLEQASTQQSSVVSPPIPASVDPMVHLVICSFCHQAYYYELSPYDMKPPDDPQILLSEGHPVPVTLGHGLCPVSQTGEHVLIESDVRLSQVPAGARNVGLDVRVPPPPIDLSGPPRDSSNYMPNNYDPYATRTN